ncbi:MAG: hypothetical protein KKC79_08605 [Gammaproteobacteria bacterium]|nr:hypothetical protein [Gammaproteobacteria bacterium]MBU1441809.1 hypothetical protein [Gammaproteobacteria bacterium]MBU2408695.1 hypothetical protein [Gammaproteobacteria bacterium]
MKYLLVFAVVFVAIWLWRKGRRDEMRERAESRRNTPKVGAPKDMARCAYCGVHLPATEALSGPGGVYCSAAHRQAAAQ